jgi:hypothetical protein
VNERSAPPDWFARALIEAWCRDEAVRRTKIDPCGVRWLYAENYNGSGPGVIPELPSRNPRVYEGEFVTVAGRPARIVGVR